MQPKEPRAGVCSNRTRLLAGPNRRRKKKATPLFSRIFDFLVILVYVSFSLLPPPSNPPSNTKVPFYSTLLERQRCFAGAIPCSNSTLSCWCWLALPACLAFPFTGSPWLYILPEANFSHPLSAPCFYFSSQQASSIPIRISLITTQPCLLKPKEAICKQLNKHGRAISIGRTWNATPRVRCEPLEDSHIFIMYTA